MLMTRAKELELIGVPRAKKAERGSLVIATSCQPEDLSTASDIDTPGEEAGWFSTAFREAVAGKADADRDGAVTVAELRTFLEAKLFVTIRKHNRQPGLAWDAQNSLCQGSPEAPDGFKLVPTDRKKGKTPSEVQDEDYVPPFPDIFGVLRTEPAPVGTWKAVKCERQEFDSDLIPKRFPVKLSGEYTLTIRADGAYTARLKENGDTVAQTTGKYEYKTGIGGRFTLIFPGGSDELQYFGRTDNQMIIRLMSDSARWGYNDYYTLEKVKD
jgi:hypothetical protein